jgi:hypothetical protein
MRQHTLRHWICLLLLALIGAVPIHAAPNAPAEVDPTLWMTDGPVYAMTQLGSTLYVGGDFNVVRPQTGGGGLLDTAGAVDTAMPAIRGEVRAAAPDGAGGWYIGGEFSSVGTMARSNLAHIRADRSVDPDWAPTTDGPVYALVLSGGVVYAGGAFTVVNGLDQGVAYLVGLDAASGALAFSGYTDGPVYALIASGSTLIAGGAFGEAGGEYRSGLAKLDMGSGRATDWNPSADGPVRALALSGDELYIGGEFAAIAGQPRSRLALVSLASGALGGWNPGADGPVYAVATYGPQIFVGGAFGKVGGKLRPHLAAIYNNGSTCHQSEIDPVRDDLHRQRISGQRHIVAVAALVAEPVVELGDVHDGAFGKPGELPDHRIRTVVGDQDELRTR